MFNSNHNRLQFTVEHETNYYISFLDLFLIKTGDKLITDWFWKNTFSYRYLSYYSCYSLCYKVGTVYSLVYSLVDRAVSLFHPNFHKKNLKLVINVLPNNDFLLNIIFNKINIRLKKFSNSKLKFNTTNIQKIDNNKPVECWEKTYIYSVHKKHIWGGCIRRH